MAEKVEILRARLGDHGARELAEQAVVDRASPRELLLAEKLEVLLDEQKQFQLLHERVKEALEWTRPPEGWREGLPTIPATSSPARTRGSSRSSTKRSPIAGRAPEFK
jgi:hypothetical protein